MFAVRSLERSPAPTPLDPRLLPSFAMAASSSPGASAVAERVYQWQELVAIAGLSPLQRWSLNSQALKYTRYLGEEPEGVLKSRLVFCEFALDQVVSIGEMEHDNSGPGFTFDSPAVAGKMVDWSPAQFLTQLRPDVLKQLELEKHGVRKLFCLAFLESVDKMRLTAAKQKGKPFDKGVVPPLWDFVLTRGDGVMFAMHPSWKNFKCKVSQLKDHSTIQRVQSCQTRKLRDWVAECYPIRGHGLYQECQDPVRDEHRRNHLASKRKGWKRWGAPAVAEESAGQSGALAVAGESEGQSAVAEESAGQSGAPAVAGESEGQSAVAEQPGGATLTFGCGARPASGSTAQGVLFQPRQPAVAEQSCDASTPFLQNLD